jgi:hypothetical protein
VRPTVTQLRGGAARDEASGREKKAVGGKKNSRRGGREGVQVDF